jgi:membrane associated rhomboid family serine protease
MFPLSDAKIYSKKKPISLFFLIALNVYIFFSTFNNLVFFIQNYGVIPKEIFEGKKLFTLFTSLFLHGSFWHLLGNMWFLWVFGENLEKRLGSLKFLFLYFLSGIFSMLFYSYFFHFSTIPLIGASGAISGVLGGYLIFFPRNRILTLIPIFFFFEIIEIPAFVFIIVWFLYQFLLLNTQSYIAYLAHIGGFLAGIFIAKLLKNK